MRKDDVAVDKQRPAGDETNFVARRAFASLIPDACVCHMLLAVGRRR